MVFLEQEMASVIRFVVDATDCVTPYYHSIPQDYKTPCVYFPAPEVVSFGSTLSSFELRFMCGVEFFDASAQKAYLTAMKALEALRERHNRITLLDADGNDSGAKMRLDDPEIKKFDDGKIQLILSWSSYRDYREAPSEMAAKFYTQMKIGG